MQVFPAACVIEPYVSVEYQGTCSRDLNLGQPESYISGIYGP